MRASREVRLDTEGDASQARFSGSRTYRLPLPPHPIAAEQARVFARLLCDDLGSGVDDLLLVAAELVTNSTKIGEVFELAISRQGWTVMVEVWDSSEAAPDRQQQSIERVDGRGLLLVEACSKDWGWRLEEHGGKTTWAIVDISDASETR